MDEIMLPTGEVMNTEELAAEYVRLRGWCAVCLGEDVAKVGGLPLEA